MQLRILQVNMVEKSGGAGRVAWNLFQGNRQRGHASWMAVAHKETQDPDVFEMPHDRTPRIWAGYWWRLRKRLEPASVSSDAARRLRRLCRGIAEPGSRLDKWLGREDFRYPGSWHLPELVNPSPQVIQCHNLHEGYFDLRALPALSRRAVTVLTLHDAWLLSGHCAHSFDCERWKIGCGKCPYLRIYPRVRRDATAFNYRRRQSIYSASRFYVATPSRWLLDKVRQSMLMAGTVEARVIPNGVDLTLFRPLDQGQARAKLGLPGDAAVVLFLTESLRDTSWKDGALLRAALSRALASVKGQNLKLVCLGEKLGVTPIDNLPIHFLPPCANPADVATALQAADVYVHPARIDTFPNMVIEGQACGCPVVATRVGGIPEQIEDGKTGYLTTPGDAAELASRIVSLLEHNDARRQMGASAVDRAAQLYDLNQQIGQYLRWMEQLVTDRARTR